MAFYQVGNEHGLYEPSVSAEQFQIEEKLYICLSVQSNSVPSSGYGGTLDRKVVSLLPLP
jgi:hypothetical protein